MVRNIPNCVDTGIKTHHKVKESFIKEEEALKQNLNELKGEKGGDRKTDPDIISSNKEKYRLKAEEQLIKNTALSERKKKLLK